MFDASATTRAAGNGSAADSAARRPIALPITLLIVAATAADLGLYALGRGIGAAMVLDPAGGLLPTHELNPWDVAWKTVGTLAAGAVVAVLVARRSRPWALALVWLAGAVGIASAIGPVLGAHDTATAWLLLGMHLTATVAGVLIALLALRRLAPR